MSAPSQLRETVGRVAGSVVVEGNRLTFVAIGGPLPTDNHTVRLHSAADVFKHVTTGVLLDGDADRTPGGDFVRQFTLAAPESKIVSLPDFRRGPSQSSDVPANAMGLPLTVNNGAGVQSINLTIRYDRDLLTITGAAPGPGEHGWRRGRSWFQSRHWRSEPGRSSFCGHRRNYRGHWGE